MRWIVYDTTCRDEVEEIEVATSWQAAVEFVERNDWPYLEGQVYYDVMIGVHPVGAPEEERVHRVPVDREEEAPGDCDHEWYVPLELVGGCSSNPGVFALGGDRYEYREVCRHCGMRKTEIWEGGWTKEITYEEPDEESDK